MKQYPDDVKIKSFSIGLTKVDIQSDGSVYIKEPKQTHAISKHATYRIPNADRSAVYLFKGDEYLGEEKEDLLDLFKRILGKYQGVILRVNHLENVVKILEGKKEIKIGCHEVLDIIGKENLTSKYSNGSCEYMQLTGSSITTETMKRLQDREQLFRSLVEYMEEQS